MAINFADIEWEDEKEAGKPLALLPEDVEWDQSDIEWETPPIWEQVKSLPGIAYKGIGYGAGKAASGLRSIIENAPEEIPEQEEFGFFLPKETKPSIAKALQTFTEAYPEPLEGIKTPGLMQQAAAGATTFIPSMALTAANIPAGVAATFTTLMGSSYDDYKKAGVENERAFNSAFFNALAQTPIEMAGNILGFIRPLKALSKTFASTPKAMQRLGAFGNAIARSMVAEGMEEYLQQYPDEIANAYAANPDMKVGDLAKYVTDNLKKIHGKAVEAAKVGAVGGAMLTGAAGAFQAPFTLAEYQRTKGEMIPGSELPGPNHPLIQKIKSDLDAGKLTPEQVAGFKDAPEIQEMGLSEQLDRVLQDRQMVERRANIAESLRKAVAAQPGEERAKAIDDYTNSLIIDRVAGGEDPGTVLAEVSRSGGEVEEVRGPWAGTASEGEVEDLRGPRYTPVSRREPGTAAIPSTEVLGEATPDMGPTNLERLRGMLYGKDVRVTEPTPKKLVKEKRQARQQDIEDQLFDTWRVRAENERYTDEDLRKTAKIASREQEDREFKAWEKKADGAVYTEVPPDIAKEFDFTNPEDRAALKKLGYSESQINEAALMAKRAFKPVPGEKLPLREPAEAIAKAAEAEKVEPAPSRKPTVAKKTPLTEAFAKAQQIGPGFDKMLTFAERTALAKAGFKKGNAYDLDAILKAASEPAKPVDLKSIKVSVKAIRGETGEEFAMERNAQEAMDELTSQRGIYTKILECLNG